MTNDLNQTVLQLADLVSRTSIMHRFRFIQAHNLSHTQMISLFYLSYHREVSINQLAKHLGITNAAVSQLIERLVRMDLVERVDNPQDRRGKLLDLTPEGRQIVQNARKTQHEWISSIVSSLEPDEAAILQKGIEIFLTKVPEMNKLHCQTHSGEKND